jgi:hypothetical protein
MLNELRPFAREWLAYFRIADLKTRLISLDGWIRRRLRTRVWKRWMRVKTRFKNLRKFGLDEERARMRVNARKGYWRVAKSPILATVITNRRLANQGYDESPRRKTNFVGSKRFTIEPPYTERRERVALRGRRGRRRLLPDLGLAKGGARVA